jgi:DegV family protein with EDD domain
MTGVAVVTDSTACLPLDAVASGGIRVVPLPVVVGDQPLDELTGASAVAKALQERVPVTTSRPSPQTFLEAYRAAAEGGATGVVSVHLSAEMSGTYGSAVLAARDSPIEVRVVDSRLVGMGLGFAALAAADAAAAGAGLDDVTAAAEKRAAVTSAYFYVDTLEHLRRGGRMGAAQAFVGTVLAVKPLLHLVDGRIQPLEKVRTATRAVARLEELVVARASAAQGTVDVAVQHLANRQRAEELAGHLRQRLLALRRLYVNETGAVIGAHVGPGLLAVVISPT